MGIRSQRMIGELASMQGISDVNECSMEAGVAEDPTDPHLGFSVAQLARDVEASITFYNDYLGDLGIESEIDEIAIIFATDQDKYRWLKGALAEPGVVAFNHAYDSVNTYPISSSYEVEYTFLKYEQVPWRIEAMHITRGVSPLHTAFLESIGTREMVHASFKVDNMRQFRKVVDLLHNDCDMAQMCRSTYGEFGYFLLEPGGDWPPYLKPRVNVRDGR